jgi:hypothetical protein
LDITSAIATLGASFEGGVALSDFASFAALPLFEFVIDALVCFG